MAEDLKPVQKTESISNAVAKRRLDGIYKQRGEHDLVIVRVIDPGACWNSEKLKLLGRLATQYGNGRLHVTTWGDVEISDVSFAAVDRIIAELDEAGLSTRGACGDCIRNISACPGSGTCENELIDAGKVARELYAMFCRQPTYEHLPRKFKISVQNGSAPGLNSLPKAWGKPSYGLKSKSDLRKAYGNM